MFLLGFLAAGQPCVHSRYHNPPCKEHICENGDTDWGR